MLIFCVVPEKVTVPFAVRLVAVVVPDMVAPKVLNTAILATPATVTVTLPAELTTRTLLLPDCMLVASMPVSAEPLPIK